MSVEQKIMSAIVQVDMFLTECWKWLLLILVMFGIFTIAYIRSGEQ